MPLRPWLVALVLSLSTLSSVARADDAACIAASEAEATLQKAARLHEALAQAALCADPSCPVDVKTECTLRIQKMSTAMPTLVIGATDENGNDLVLVQVTLDGAPLTGNLDGHALAIDPGTHVLRFESPGKPPVEKSIVLREGEKDRPLRVVLGVKSEQGDVVGSARTSASWSTQKTLALSAAGVGVVGIVIGAVTGAMASSSWSTAKDLCSTTSCPSTTRMSAESSHDAAVTSGTLSTIAFVVGVAGLGGGAALWFTATHAEPKSPSATPLALRVVPELSAHGGGLGIGGSFQ